MKKLCFSLILVLWLVIFLNAMAYAHEMSSAPQGIVEIYKFDDRIAAGYKHHLANRFYLTTNIEYHEGIEDLKLQLGTVYLLPHKVLFCDLYGGGGIQISRSDDYEYPYLTVGARFIFFFYEMIYPWEDEVEPLHRAGLSFKLKSY